MTHLRWIVAFALAATPAACSDVPPTDEAPATGGTDGGAATEDSGGNAAAADATVAPPPSDAGTSDATSEAAIDAGITYSGEATYYAADGTGACGYPASANLMVTALNKSQYKKAECGKCVRVKGPKGEVTVRIVDLCPGCKYGDLDLSEEAFAQVANMSAGRVKISWTYVTCP